jgi:hypothetical protein
MFRCHPAPAFRRVRRGVRRKGIRREAAGPSAQKDTADGDDRDHYDDQKPELSTEHIRPFDEASAHILISNYFIFTRHYFENSKICGIMANDYYIFF